LLLSAGFALSAGIEKRNFSLWLGSHMRILHFMPYGILPLVVAVIINIITEFTANAATATLFLPLLADVALSLNVHPLLLMIAATFASNFSFMLPVATPPNAIAHATGYIHTADLMIQGLLLKLFGTFLLTVLMAPLGEMLGTTTYPLFVLPSQRVFSRISFLPSFLLSACLSTETLFQVLTFDPSCFSCF
jgi:sodium-dependent dicarboxylate transporter 2/3/5